MHAGPTSTSRPRRTDGSGRTAPSATTRMDSGWEATGPSRTPKRRRRTSRRRLQPTRTGRPGLHDGHGDRDADAAAASGGNGVLSYSLSPDVPGLTFDAVTRQLTGTPNTAASYDMTYTVTDEDGDTDTLGFTIAVNPASTGRFPGRLLRGPAVGIGQSCTYPGTTDEFSVNVRGRDRSWAAWPASASASTTRPSTTGCTTSRLRTRARECGGSTGWGVACSLLPLNARNWTLCSDLASLGALQQTTIPSAYCNHSTAAE